MSGAVTIFLRERNVNILPRPAERAANGAREPHSKCAAGRDGPRVPPEMAAMRDAAGPASQGDCQVFGNVEIDFLRLSGNSISVNKLTSVVSA